MICSICGFTLSQGMAYCPRCGAFTNDQAVNNNQTPTISSYPLPPTMPASATGADPYTILPPTYIVPNIAPPPPPPPIIQTPTPPPGKKRGWQKNVAIIAAVVVVILLPFFLFHNSSNHNQLQSKAKTPTTPPSTPTVNPAKNPYSPYTGTLALADPMHDNSKGYKWDEGSQMINNGTNGKIECGFSNQAYHIISTVAGGAICDPEAANLVFSNVAYEANLTIQQGTYAGLVVRFNQPAGGTGYLFYIDIQGNYAIGAELPATNNAAASFKPLKRGTNAAIKKGLNQANLVAIVADNQTLDVYVNGQYIDSTQDNTYTTGQLGIYGGGDTTASDITASSVRVWKL